MRRQTEKVEVDQLAAELLTGRQIEGIKQIEVMGYIVKPPKPLSGRWLITLLTLVIKRKKMPPG
jgi:hypothetical protein